MATHTVTGDGAVIHRRPLPASCRVTTVAGIGGRNVRCMLTGSNHAVMTGYAATIHLCVIHVSRRAPSRNIVTGIALICGIDMGYRSTRCRYTIVTTLTTTACFVVVHDRDRRPDRINVTGLTGIAGIDMHWDFAACTRAVMAGRTKFGRKTVIKHRHQPVSRCVARIASQRGGNMFCTHAGGNNAVMTGCTGTQHLRMINRNQRHPIRISVT